MKMDLSTIAIGVISTLAFVLPFTLMYINTKKRNTKAFEHLNKLAEQQNCVIHEKEVFAGLSLGIDKNKKALFFVNSNENQGMTKSIELSNFSKCLINRVNKEFVMNNEKQNIITNIDLIFIGKVGFNDEKIEIFDHEKKSQLFGELQLADRWHSKINAIVSSM
jgi:hypothetical protein